MQRIRRGRPPQFTSIPNHVIDAMDDVLAIGLLACLLRLPDNYNLTMDQLAARKKGTSRNQLYKAMRVLVDLGHVVKVRYQDDRGQWATDVYTFETPAEPDEVATLALQYGRSMRVEPEWLAPAATATDHRQVVVGATCDDAPNPQVAPTTGNRPVGSRPVGFPQVKKKKTEKKTEKKNPPPPSPPLTSPTEAPTTAQEEGGVIDLRIPTPTDRDDAMATQAPAVDMRDQAVALVEALPDPWRPSRGHKQRPEILRLVADALAEGWAPAALTHHLLSDPPRELHAPGRLLVARLQELPAPRRGRPRQRVAVSDPHASDLAQSHAAGALQDPTQIAAAAAAARAAVRQTRARQGTSGA